MGWDGMAEEVGRVYVVVEEVVAVVVCAALSQKSTLFVWFVCGLVWF